MKKLLLVLAVVACAWPALAASLPIEVSSDAINGSPLAKMDRAPGGDVWSMEWYWDDQRRVLRILLVKAMQPATRDLPPETMESVTDVILQGGPGDQADIRKEGDGTIDIWGGKANWILGSGYASNAPLFTTDEERQKATRGPERNYCLSFGWMSKNRRRVMEGIYCKVLPVGETTTAEAMLTALDLRFR
jgi:hypothetical protein